MGKPSLNLAISMLNRGKGNLELLLQVPRTIIPPHHTFQHAIGGGRALSVAYVFWAHRLIISKTPPEPAAD